MGKLDSRIYGRNKEMKSAEDKELLRIYYQGWEDEANFSELEKRAYNIGKAHFITGDDVSSVDLLSDVEILAEIKNEKQI